MFAKPSIRLTYEGAQAVLQAAVKKAEEMGVPQCIAIVDEGGNLLAFARMDGGKVLSILSAQTKAVTAASIRQPTGGGDKESEIKLALAQGGRYTNLKGGLPLIIDGQVVGGIGVGSGTGDQDAEVARAGAAVLERAGR